MHDNNIPSGESIVRQYLSGKSYFRDALGYDVTTGWGLDTFGHNAQMPQILKLAGMKSYWFQRGCSGHRHAQRISLAAALTAPKSRRSGSP